MSKTAESPKTLIGVAEASELTGLDRRTLHRKVERGELTAITKLPGLRGAYIFNRSDILALTTPVEPVSPEATGSAGVFVVPTEKRTA